MKLYINNGRYFGTKAEAGKGGTLEEVPTDKPGLIPYLNAMAEVIVELASKPERPVLPVPERETPTRPDPLQFDDAWEEMSLARKAHFAALFCEEARLALKPAKPLPMVIEEIEPEEEEAEE